MATQKEDPIVHVAPYYPQGDGQFTVDSGPAPNSPAIPNKNSRAYRDIALACLIISFPMVVLTAALLGLIYKHQIKQTSDSPAALQLSNAVENDASAYLVDFSATRLITIASWTSSVAPLLPGFVMILLSFPAARGILGTSQASQYQSLPTPYQLGLYLQLLTGGAGALYQWLKYRFWGKREKQAPVITTLVAGLISATIIGYAILAVDTWLHVVTSTVIFHQITPISDSSPAHSYGRVLYSSECDRRHSQTEPCTVFHSASTNFITNGAEAYATLNNLSTVNQISTFSHNNRNYALLLPYNAPRNIDYRATTFAISTSCVPVSQACNMKAAYGASTPFNCTPGFSGDATANEDIQTLGGRRAGSPVGYVLLEDGTGKTNITFGSKDMNPFYLGTWALVQTQVKRPDLPASEATGKLQKDPEIITPVHGGMAWVLKCQSNVYDLTYTWMNGSVQSPDLKLSNASTGGLIAAPVNGDFALPNFEIAAYIASFSASAQELANKWGDQLSQFALGLSAGVMSPHSNLLQQSRTEKLVARVPKAPLYALVLLNLIYAVLGLVLAVYAAVFAGVGRGTGAARQRLTVHGLVAECFERSERAPRGRNKSEECFDEREGGGISGRVGVEDGVDGGMRFLRI